jgi:hypothetical protein
MPVGLVGRRLDDLAQRGLRQIRSAHLQLLHGLRERLLGARRRRRRGAALARRRSALLSVHPPSSPVALRD